VVEPHDERRRNHSLVELVETTAAFPPDATTARKDPTRKFFEEFSESVVDKGFPGLRLSVVTA
jgi:hypothetical protein